MKILMTNYYLGGVSGSESCTFTVAQELRWRGHDVQLMYGEFTKDGKGRDELADFCCIGIDSGAWFGNWAPDIIHAHQNPTAVKARKLFPETPMVYVCHSTYEGLERPPLNCNVSHWMAVSQEIALWMSMLPQIASPVDIIGQPINTKRFRPTEKLRKNLGVALIVSARIDPARQQQIQKACDELAVTLNMVGGRFGWVSQDEVAERMNQADVVFSMGRGVYEAMACGRVPIIFDHFGGDGIVYHENVDYLARFNFSGRAYGEDLSDNLRDILQCYDYEEGERLRQWVVQRYAVEKVVDRLEEIYKEVQDEEAGSGTAGT